MKSPVRRVLRALFPEMALHYRAYTSLIRNENSYLHATGWMESLRESKPTDLHHDPLPWMNYPVIQLLDSRLRGDQRLFEFGSGHSTHFYARRVRCVTSVEHDEGWFRTVQAQLPGNVELLFREMDIDGDYCRAIAGAGNGFDVVVVDGRDRVNCIRQSIPALSPRGVILLDDSQRERYREGIEFAREQGFRTLDIEGLKATGLGIDRTTIFYRDGNCLGL